MDIYEHPGFTMAQQMRRAAQILKEVLDRAERTGFAENLPTRASIDELLRLSVVWEAEDRQTGNG